MSTRKPYPSDVSDEEWAFVVPYLTLLPLDAAQRVYDLREVFDAARWLVRTGAPWRMIPHDFPRWEIVYQQTQRWIAAGCFESLVNDFADAAPPTPRAASESNRCDLRQPHDAIHPRKR